MNIQAPTKPKAIPLAIYEALPASNDEAQVSVHACMYMYMCMYKTTCNL